MRKTLVAGNWKMNSPDESSKTLLENILHDSKMLDSILKDQANANAIDIALFPPSVYLREAQENTNWEQFALGHTECICL